MISENRAAGRNPGAVMHTVLQIVQTSQVLEKAAQRIFTPHGLTAAQFNVLNLLADKPQGLRASDLAAHMVVDPSNVSHILRRMSRDGLVTDLENDGDKRQRIVTLTAKGRQLWKKGRTDYECCLDALDALITPKEKRIIETALLRVVSQTGNLIP